MAPGAALIVVRPCIEVNAIKGDALDADAEREDAGRTSRLKRFLSIPRYVGASRNRMKRGSGAVSAFDVWFRTLRGEMSLMAHVFTQ
jgi:hypothetical protein